MSARFTIELKGLRFYAEHGMYAEELKVGNEFEIDLSLECKAPKKTITSIEQTVNYVEVYRIVQEEFSKRRALLETCAMELADRLQEQFSDLDKITISIKKINPPITNFSGVVGVTYCKSFK
jgi:dihydroneopterin aldolase